MAVRFTKEDYKNLIRDIDEMPILDLDEAEIRSLTEAIARVKGSEFKKDHVIMALEQYKKDMIRIIMWKSVLNGLINLDISDDGTEIAFVPDNFE